MTVRVLVAERDPERRGLIRVQVETIPGFEVVGHALDAHRAVGLCAELAPQILVIGLADEDQIDGVLLEVRANCPDVKVLVIAGPSVAPPEADSVLTRPVGTDTFVSSLLELADGVLSGGEPAQ